MQDDIEDAPLFDEAIELFEDWVGFDDTRSMLMSWGSLTVVNSPTMHDSTTWTWLRYLASPSAPLQPLEGVQEPNRFENALDMEGLSFDGTQHRAIEDARNMAKLFAKVAKPLSIV